MKHFQTRRAVMAGLAASPVAGLPAIAAPTGQDTAFIALAEVERTKEKAVRGRAAYDAAYEAYNSAVRAIGTVTFRGQEVRNLGRLSVVAEDARLADISAKKDLKAWEKEYAEAFAALSARVGDYEKAHEDLQIVALDEMDIEASAEWERSRAAAFEAAPSTPEGAIAFLRFIAEFLDDGAVNDARVEDHVGDAIRRAVDVLDTKSV